MSVAEHFARVRAIRESALLEPNDRLLLLIIESYADNDNGRGAWPSKATIAADTGLDARTVNARLERLRTLAWLDVRPGAGPHGCHVYRVTPVANDRRPPPRGPGRPSPGGAVNPPSLDEGGFPNNHPHPEGGGAVKPPSLDAKTPLTGCPPNSENSGRDPERTAVCDQTRARAGEEHTHTGPLGLSSDVTGPAPTTLPVETTTAAPEAASTVEPRDPFLVVARGVLKDKLPRLVDLAPDVAAVANENGRTLAELATAIHTLRAKHGELARRPQLMSYVLNQRPLDPSDEERYSRELRKHYGHEAPRNPRKVPGGAPPPAAPPPTPPAVDYVARAACYKQIRDGLGGAPLSSAGHPMGTVSVKPPILAEAPGRRVAGSRVATPPPPPFGIGDDVGEPPPPPPVRSAKPPRWTHVGGRNAVQPHTAATAYKTREGLPP
jgi:hypothetical protein